MRERAGGRARAPGGRLVPHMPRVAGGPLGTAVVALARALELPQDRLEAEGQLLKATVSMFAGISRRGIGRG